MTSIRDYATKVAPSISIKQYAQTGINFDLGRIQNEENAFNATQQRLQNYKPRTDVNLDLQYQMVKAGKESEIPGLAPDRAIGGSPLKKKIAEKIGAGKFYDYMSKASGAFSAGTADLIGNIGQGISWLGSKKEGEGAFDRTGAKLQAYAKESSDLLTDTNALADLGEFQWSDLKNPEYWQNTIMRQLPTQLAFLAPAILTGGVSTLVMKSTGLVKIAPFASKIINTIAGAGGSAALESTLEAGQTYSQAMEKFGSEEVANKAANRVFMKNMSLLSGSNFAEFLLALTPAKNIPFFSSSKLLRTGAKIAATSAMEGTEELLQNKFQTEAMGDKFSASSPQSKEAFGVGAMFGGITGGAGEIYANFSEKTSSNLRGKAKEEFDKKVQAEIQKGKDEMTAKSEVLNSITEKYTTQTGIAIRKTVQEMNGGKDFVEEQNVKKPVNIKESDLKSIDSIDRFLAKNENSLSLQQINKLQDLQDRIYKRENSITESKQSKIAGLENPIFNDGETESGYATFKKLIRNMSTEKIQNNDIAGLEKILGNRKTELNNSLYSQEKTGDEMLDIFRERLLRERGVVESFKKTYPKTEINDLTAEIFSELSTPEIKPVKVEEVVKNLDIPEVSAMKKIMAHEKNNIENVSKNYPEQRGSKLKAIGYEYSAIKRGLEGNPTTIEKENTLKYLSSNYKGKKVETIGFGLGTVVGTAYGKIKVKLEDGSIKSFGTEQIKEKSISSKEILEKIKTDALEKIKGRGSIFGMDFDSILKSEQKVADTNITQNTKPQEVVGEVKTENEVQDTQKVSDTEFKKSKFFQRVKNKGIESLKNENGPDYKVENVDEAILGATRFVEQNPEQAIRIANRLEDAPKDLNSTFVSIAVFDMLKNNNTEQFVSAVQNTSLSLTKKGQEINAAKYISKDSAEYFISQAFQERIQNIKIDYDKTKRDVRTGERISKSEAVSEKITKEAKKINKAIDKKAADMTNAQDLINSILCK